MGNISSTQQQSAAAAAVARGRRRCSTATGGATTTDSSNSITAVPVPQQQQQPRHHKTRRSQESHRRRKQSSASPTACAAARSRSHRNNNNSNSSRNSHSDQQQQQQQDAADAHHDEQLDRVVKVQHSLSDATTSSSNDSSSPESPNDGVSAYTSARVRTISEHADLLTSLRMRYHDALPRIARSTGDECVRRESSSSSSDDPTHAAHRDSSVLSSILHQLACMHWRSYIPCHRESASESRRESCTSPSSEPHRGVGASPLSASASAFFFSFDAKYIVEQKHRAFWELVQKLLILNDAVVMIRLLLEYLQQHMDVAACAVFLIDQTTQVMSRFSPDKTSVSGIDPARGVLGKTLATREALCRANFAADASYDRAIDLDQTWSKQKLLCVPLIENDVVYAVIQATTKTTTRREIDELHVKLLSWLGPILGSCMRKCIEFHDVLLSDRTQKALLHIISSSDTEDTVLNLVDGVIAGACHITKAERLTLFMVDWETAELWSLSSSYHAETLRLPLHASILGHAAMTRLILNVSEPASDARYSRQIDQRRGVETRCALYVPVGVQNATTEGSSRPIAVLEILNKVDGDEFTFDDECAFEAFASQVAVILRRRSNEIEYLKLLADTRAEKVLAQRAKSQVNILEQYTSYSSTMHGHAPLDVPRSSGITNLHISSWHRTLERQLSKSAACGPSIPSWDFNVFLADMDTLPQLVEDMFTKFHVAKVLGVTPQCVRNFIALVQANYHPNPFHNFVHAFSVVHTAYLLLSTTDARHMLQPLDIAACLIAALCHDVDHPGHTNAFEIQSGSQLAMLYSDESVLERHHAYTTFKLIAKEKRANILEHLSPSDYRHVRKVIITAILGTDMAGHFKFCETLEKTLKPPARHFSSNALGVAAAAAGKKDTKTLDAFGSGSDKIGGGSSRSEIRSVLRDAVFQSEGSAANTPRTSNSAPSMGFCYPSKTFSGSSQTSTASQPSTACLHESSNIGSGACAGCTTITSTGWSFNGSVDERIFLVKTIVHASDLSGQVFTKPVALKWSNMISKEFAYQALLEQAENRPISYHHVSDPLQMVEGQLFFAQKIVAPLWDLMHIMFPEVDVCVQNLADNVAHYEQELARLKLSSVTEEERPVSDAVPIGSGVDLTFVDEGLAVPGLAKCTPARFNSFRSLREASESFDEGDDTWGTDRSVRDFAASALGALAMERARQCTTSRSSSSSSAEDEDDDVVTGFLEEFNEQDCAALLSGRY